MRPTERRDDDAPADAVADAGTLPRSERFNLDTFREMLRAAGVDESRLEVDSTGTIALPVDALPAPLGELPVLGRDQLKLRAALGKGGMGVVRLGEQVSLAREVAVKCAVPGASDRHRAAVALVQEARITGALEHPNVVPIHALGRTEDGEALLVMKRIEGESWADLLAARPSTAHDLDRHLEILLQVCHAVHFAHRRGVVHRDLKPANVMVGSFGEVYVLDWGIAVCVGDVDIPGARHARDIRSVTGTPQFMAPEMTTPGAGVDERTDVYLLGGLLHVIVAGRPPHEGAEMAELLHAAWTSAPPSLPPGVPAELAAICARALARHPRDRFDSAEDMRAALVEFSRHAGARALVAEADEQLTKLQGAVAARREGPDADLDVARAFSAARFGFEQALRAWPESPDARAGLRATLTAMARWELHRRHADAARVLVMELGAHGDDGAPPDVAGALAALEEELRREADAKAALEAAARANDPRMGVGVRAVLYLALLVTWCSFAVYSGGLHRAGAEGAPTALRLTAANLALGVGFAAVAAWLRRRGVRDLNARIFAGGAFVQGGIAASWLVLHSIAAPLHVGLSLAHLLVGVGLAVGAIFVERRLLVAAAVAFSGCPLAWAFPRWCFEANAFVIAATILVMASGAVTTRGPSAGDPRAA